MIASLLPLFIAIPLLSAGLLVIARVKWLERLLMIAVPIASFVGAGALVAYHQSEPVISNAVGGFVPGVAIVFVSDTTSALLLTVTGFITALCGAYLIGSGEDRYRFVPPLVLMLSGGVNGALLTGDLFNLFVFVEVMLLPSYALVALTGAWRRLGVGRMFVIVNLMASTILVVGVGFVYGVTGTVNLAQLAGVGADNPRATLAISVVMLALLVKAGAVPLHGWLPRSYPATSAGIMALFSALHTKVGLYALYRIYATVFGERTEWLPILSAVVIATILVGALSTFGERRIRGALAFQMVAGVGQILVGLVVFTQLSLAAGLFYMVHHMITMGALIMATGAVEDAYGSGRFDRLHGLMRREPAVATIMAFGLASLVGLPPTSGLWGKLGLLAGAAQAPAVESWILIGSIAAASIISLIALQRVWVQVFFGRPMTEFLPDDPLTSRGDFTPITEDTRTSWRLLWPAATLIAISIGLFFAIGWVWPFFDGAAQSLLDVSAYVEAVLG